MCFCSFGPDVSEMSVSKFQIWKWCEAVSGFGGLFSRMDPVSRSGCWDQMFSSRFLLCLFSLCLKTTTSSHTAEKQRCAAWQRHAALTVAVYSPLSQTHDQHSFLLLLLYGEIIKTQTNWRNQEGGDAVFVGLSAGLYRTARHAVCVRACILTQLHDCMHVCVIRSACYAASHYIHMVVPHTQFYFHVFKYGQ